MTPESAEPVKPQMWLLRWLFDTRISMRRYVLRTGLISLLPSLVLTFVLALSGIITEETGPAFDGSPLELIVLIVIVGRPLETLLMALPRCEMAFFSSGLNCATVFLVAGQRK